MDKRGNDLSTVMHPGDITIQDFSYHLPDEKIALHPLPKRDASRLLVYKAGQIFEDVFRNIANLLPVNSFLVFNKTKVINARILFRKTSGAAIEIFCLEPEGPVTEYSKVMSTKGSVRWKCLVGGAAKWKNETLEKTIQAEGHPVVLKAVMLHKETDAYTIQLSWTPATFDFATVLSAAGDVPLPPYIKRITDAEDTDRYQTIFAEKQGSVAAPTAGLHFSEDILGQLPSKNISKNFVTLHVGAGTFKPVKAATMSAHEMHAEYIDVEKSFIRDLLANDGQVIAVGTTSMRTIESLYWLGVKTYLYPGITKLSLSQWEIYEDPLRATSITAQVAFKALLHWMEVHRCPNLFTQTQLLIAPGYRFRVVDVLITNFHQPQSTLLLLVAAAIGDNWKLMYEYALLHEFRFLSYGDSNLIYIDR